MKFRQLLCLSLLIININEGFSKCNIEDWKALKALYESTGGNNWVNQAGWEVVNGTLPTTYCNLALLHGIELKYDRVTEIKLSENNLTGTIPNEIANLTSLQYLDFYNNKISGQIPSELGNLTNLWGVNLGMNNLYHNIPETLGNLPNLTHLNLSNNQLTGQIPHALGYLPELRRLDLGNNSLTGEIPNSLTDLYYFEELKLNNNLLTGQIPAGIGQLERLVVLSLSNNKLSGQIPKSLGNLSNLGWLNLKDNYLSSLIPKTFGNLRSLKELNLGNNNLTGTIPDTLATLTNLTKLRLVNNKLSGGIPSSLGKLVNLIDLSLYSNQLSGTIPTKLGSLSKLKWLSLWENQLVGKIPKEIGKLTTLTHLSLGENMLSGSIPVELKNLTYLEELDLGNNFLYGKIPAEFGMLTKLKRLDLDNNKLSGSIPISMLNLKQLKEFWIWNNKLSGAIPEFTNEGLLLNISQNYFSCEEIVKYYGNKTIPTYKYSPQFYNPFNDVSSNVVQVNASINLEAPFVNENNSLQYQWKQNGHSIHSANSSKLNINNIKGVNAGKYTLHITNVGCMEGLEFISDPNYVIVKGYNFEGQSVGYSQVLMEFDNPQITDRNDIALAEQAGWIIDKCNCNREIYLWQIPGNEQDANKFLSKLIVKTEKKVLTIRKRNEIDGSFSENFRIADIDEGLDSAYKISHEISGYFAGPVTVYLLDSGLDESNYNANPFLLSQVSKEDCYNISGASGYGYTDVGEGITTDYKDENGHGTYGFRTITGGLNSNHNIKIVPLKVFNENGEGNLFKLICALYHAIDNEADIINISAGYKGEPAPVLDKAIALAKEKGIFIVTSAGNNRVDIDNSHQYPGKYANMPFEVEDYDLNGDLVIEESVFDHVISVASISINNQLSGFSNYGKKSVTLSTYGEKIYGHGLEGALTAPSGTSMAAFIVTKELALEIGENKNRSQQQIWSDFVSNRLIDNPATANNTITGKRLNVNISPINYNNIGGGRLTVSNKSPSIQIYPSPATDWLTINLNNTVKTDAEANEGNIFIYDVSGNIVFEKSTNAKSKISLNVKELKSDQYYYILFLNDKGGYSSTSFLKM